MPTYTFTRTLQEMRVIILRKLGYRGIGDTASGEEAAIVDEGLNLRLKELHAWGVMWFNVAPAATDLSLTAGVATVSLSAVTDFLYAQTVAVRVSGEDYPVDIIGHDQYQSIQSKSDSGQPEKVYIAAGTAYFWPTPNTAYTAKLTYQAIAADVEAGETPDVRQEMIRCLVDIVTADLVDDFAVPEAKAQRLMMKGVAAEKRLQILNSQRVTATTVAVDYF